MEFKILEDGKEIKCKSILVFKDDNNDINYIVYKEENNDEMYASRYSIIDKNIVLQAIENEYEWNLIDNMIEKSGKK